MRVLAFFVLLGIVCAVGCGTPGAPLPPSTNIPKPVDDLNALRKGDTVTLTWTAPQETTDGALLKVSGKMRVRRALLSSENNTAIAAPADLAELPLKPALKDQQQEVTYKDSLAQLLQSNANDDFAVYMIDAVNNSGKGAGPSNRVAVPLVLTPATPASVQAQVVPEGIGISWNQSWPPQKTTHLNPQYSYRIMRLQEGSKQPVTVTHVNAGNEAMRVIDQSIEWEKTYDYWVVPVTAWQSPKGQKGEVEGADSPRTKIIAHDIFPPAAPVGLQGVFSNTGQQSFIDLTWTPNTEPDLAGYNVYRHTGNTPPVKINQELVKAPAFRDSAVQSGTQYFYSVTAVDLRGNESAKSPEASENVPRL